MRLMAVTASLLACTIAMGQTVLRYNYSPGFAYQFNQSMEMDLDMQIEASGQRFNARQSMTQQLRGRVVVLETADALPTRLRLAMEQGSGLSITGGGQTRFVPDPLAGRTVIVTLVPDGPTKIESIEGDEPLPMVDPQTRETITDLVTPNPSFLPNRAVAVGDEWTATLGKPTDQVRTMVTLRVDGFAEREGRRVARLTARSDLAQPLDGLTLTGNLAGTIVVDVETGHEVDVNMTGPVKTDGVVMQGAEKIDIKSTGSMTQTNKVSIGAVDQDRTPAAEPDARPAGAMLPGWKRYTDVASGFSFQHPERWTVKTNPAGLVMIPDDHQPQREMLVSFGMPAGGVTDAAAPVVQQGGRSVFARGIEPDGALVLRNPQTRKLINFFPRVRD